MKTINSAFVKTAAFSSKILRFSTLMLISSFLLASCERADFNSQSLKSVEFPDPSLNSLSELINVEWIEYLDIKIPAPGKYTIPFPQHPDFETFENFTLYIENGYDPIGDLGVNKTQTNKIEILVDGITVITQKDFKHVNYVRKPIAPFSVTQVYLGGGKNPRQLRWIHLRIMCTLKPTVL